MSASGPPVDAATVTSIAAPDGVVVFRAPEELVAPTASAVNLVGETVVPSTEGDVADSLHATSAIEIDAIDSTTLLAGRGLKELTFPTYLTPISV